MSKFNDYLKYVKGHSEDTTSIVAAIPDRLNTAIARRFADNVTASKGVPVFKMTKVVSTPDLIYIVCKPIGGYKYKINIDLEDYTVSVTHKADAEYKSSIFTNSVVRLRTNLNHFIDLEKYFDTKTDNEVSRYIRDSIDKIGMVNVKTNIIVIAILEILDTVRFFAGYEPSPYRSSKPGAPAHVDDGNNKADESANSMI